ncbi:MAG: TetR/AcrR family transcriptional regulator [Parvularculaceae bacterium]
MARTQSPDYGVRRREIVEKAADEFARHNFHKASMADIARAWGGSKAALYHYFPSKEEILFAVMEDHTALLLETADRIAKSDAPPADKLRDLARRFMEIYVGARSRHKVLLNDLDALPPAERRKIVEQQDAIIDRVGDILFEINPDAAPKGARKAAAMMFMGVLNWTHTWFKADGPLSPAEFADMAANTFLHGINAHMDGICGAHRAREEIRERIAE